MRDGYNVTALFARFLLLIKRTLTSDQPVNCALIKSHTINGKICMSNETYDIIDVDAIIDTDDSISASDVADPRHTSIDTDFIIGITVSNTIIDVDELASTISSDSDYIAPDSILEENTLDLTFVEPDVPPAPSAAPLRSSTMIIL